ncbi:hypothetical protein IAQ61_003675 [Plenodomus lingam]|uniref:uncharacterized protein n=1 Tax=Leptosphaeria maculans TaxID=5022 RepID=UPI0033220237|nr:hypothetical protein IAQ61_003675 [Plenodomus lingam]
MHRHIDLDMSLESGEIVEFIFQRAVCRLVAGPTCHEGREEDKHGEVVWLEAQEDRARYVMRVAPWTCLCKSTDSV